MVKHINAVTRSPTIMLFQITSITVSISNSLPGWRSVNALASHRCDLGSIPSVRDGHVVTKSDRWVSSGYSGFLPHKDHPNSIIGANEHD